MKYYTSANTAGGFVDFTEENIFDVKRKILLKGSSCYVKNLVLKLAFEYTEKECEQIIKEGSEDLLSGIILNNREFAVLSKCENPDKVINLDNFFGAPQYNPKTKYLFECMHNSFYEAKHIHDEWERVYIENMDFKRLEKYTDEVIKSISLPEKSGEGKKYKRFFGTVTESENVNFIDELTEDLSKRYFIKGRPGTGKSTFLKKLSKKLVEKGFDVEEYYCSFDKESLDMVISREFSLAVFDSTPPHEKFPERDGDEVLDFYVNSGLEGVDEKYEDVLSKIKGSYDMKIKEGKSFFRIAKELKEASEKQMLSKIKDDDLLVVIKSIFNG